VPRKGAALDSEAMLADLKQQLANFKVPKRIHFTDQLVRNTMGKVQKNVLREKYKTL
jgi:malonyl-CoA/methylmalonyl-CoA synthetase